MRIAVDEINRLVIIVVIGILMMIDDPRILGDPLKECRDVIIMGDKQFGNATASQTEIIKEVAGEQLKVLFRFLSRQYSNAVAVFSDDMWLLTKVIGEISCTVI